MGNFFVLRDVYFPGMASINRMLSFLHGFDKAGIEVNVVFFMPDKNRSKVDSANFKHIHFIYLWEHSKLCGRYTKYISGYINAIKFRHILKMGDSVLMLHSVFPDIIFGKRGVRYYQEFTEHPDVVAFHTIPFDKKRKRLIKYVNKSDGLFVISTSLKEYFKSKGVSESKIHIINMTVDTTRFEGLKKQDVDYPYIAYCGTASNNKDGVDELIKAFALVHGKYPEYKLYIIGDTPSKQDQSGNLALIKMLRLENAVIFTGRISPNEMPQVLKNAKIMALDRPDSLQAQNGFPTKLGEYLLTGNPVVITKVGDIPHFLEDRKSALLANERDQVDFASKIIWAIEHPTEANEIGMNGASVARIYFNYYTESLKILKVILK